MPRRKATRRQRRQRQRQRRTRRYRKSRVQRGGELTDDDKTRLQTAAEALQYQVTLNPQFTDAIRDVYDHIFRFYTNQQGQQVFPEYRGENSAAGLLDEFSGVEPDNQPPNLKTALNDVIQELRQLGNRLEIQNAKRFLQENGFWAGPRFVGGQRGGACTLPELQQHIDQLNQSIANRERQFPNIRINVKTSIAILLANRNILRMNRENDLGLLGQGLDNLRTDLFDLCKFIKECLINEDNYYGERFQMIINALRASHLYGTEEPVVFGAPLPGVNANGNAVGPLNVAQQLVFANNNGPPFVLGPNNNHVVQALQFGNGNMSPIAHQPNN
jgi:hypothetical protein